MLLLQLDYSDRGEIDEADDSRVCDEGDVAFVAMQGKLTEEARLVCVPAQADLEIQVE